jgi:hypothetical protein
MCTHGAQVEFVQNAVNDADGSSLDAVASAAWLTTGISYSTATAPAEYGAYRFAYWTVNNYSATDFRDAWGRSRNPASFVLLEPATATAHYLPTTRDTDGDGIPDWYVMEYCGTLTNSASYDGDGDGRTLAQEYSGGTSPLFADSSQPGGVSWADSGSLTCNLAGYASYVLRSEPPGTVYQSVVAPTGTVVTTPSFSGNAAFGYWTLDGARQQDAWGVALRQFSFVMGATDREAVAYLFSGDDDNDNVSDAIEYYFYGSLTNGAASDTDGDGLTLAADPYPLFGQGVQEGGVAWADSQRVVVDLQGFDAVQTTLLTGAPTLFFSASPTGAVPSLTAANSHPALGDWDGDGDLDLFIGGSNGTLRIFENAGSPRVLNLVERTSNFTALAFAWTNIVNPAPALGDWSGDGRADLAIGGGPTSVVLIQSTGSFTSSPVSSFQFPVSGTPSLLDVNHDARPDLLLLSPAGLVSAYTNTHTPTPPYSDTPFSTNLLGTAVPSATGLTTADVNNDGIPDLLISDDNGNIWEFHGAGP